MDGGRLEEVVNRFLHVSSDRHSRLEILLSLFRNHITQPVSYYDRLNEIRKAKSTTAFNTLWPASSATAHPSFPPHLCLEVSVFVTMTREIINIQVNTSSSYSLCAVQLSLTRASMMCRLAK